jgi:hypothetical protein
MANNENQKIKLIERSYVFPRETVMAQSMVSRQMLEDLATVHRDGPFRMAEIETHPDLLLGGVLIYMRTYLLASSHKNTEILSVRSPETWWDHFKHDMLMSSNHPVLRRIVSHFAPPAYKYESKQVVTETRMCPHNNTYFSEDEAHAHWLSWSYDDANSVTVRD